MTDATCCRQCALPGASDAICGQCLRDTPRFDRTLAAFEYRFPLDRLVQSFKFRADLKLVDFFVAAMAARVSPAISATTRLPDLLVALPLANQRLRERGFNQSALLADGLARVIGRPVAHGAMLRIRETPPQSGLDRPARIKNIRGAFDCRDNLTGKHVALIDDVMTTGATLSEAASVLKKAGAQQVDAWVLSRAVLEHRHD
jgi:ComF family protein